LLLGVLAVALVVVVGTIEGLRKVDWNLVRLGLVLGFRRLSMFRRIMFPALIPHLVGPIRVALAVAVSVVVASEFMGAQYGLGYLINVSRFNLATPTILLCIALLGVIGGVYDWLIRVILRTICGEE
jgi:ABC-type nitrate/sulfonate/bicarbonate transport system permease component